MSRNTVGIILAGGQSRRFGTPKAFALLKGIPFYQYSINVMEPFVESIVLVSNNDLIDKFERDAPNINLIIDNPAFAGLGPLAGIYSGMESIESEWYLVSPIDVPFMEESVWEILLENIEVGKDAIVPMVNGRMQPLISIFHQSVKGKIERQLISQELSLKQLIAKCQVKWIEIEKEESFRNINYQDDLYR
jgi:molybdenum cofactor guanylyltransferase